MKYASFVIIGIAIFIGVSVTGQYDSITAVQAAPSLILSNLLDGNARYVSGETRSVNLPEDRAALAAGQSPDVVVIRCADSRVAPEIVFDQELGDLFVFSYVLNVF